MSLDKINHENLKPSGNVLDLRQSRKPDATHVTNDIKRAPETSKISRHTYQGFTALWELIYKTISSFGKLLGWIFNIIVQALKLVKFIIFAPIKALDTFLDKSLKALKWLAQTSWYLLKKTLRESHEFARQHRFTPPQRWSKALTVFAGLAFALTLPFQLITPLKQLSQKPQEVLGASAEALELIGLAAIFHDYIPVAQVASDMLGYNEPKRLLILFQNNRELRATGGFLGSYALMDIERGQITSLDVPGGGFYDLKGAQTRFVAAPRPFRVFAPYWQIWNANWFADFPTSARKLAWFYDVSGGPTVDGIIALTPDVIEALLKITGPIDLPKYDKTITAENFVRETQLEVELEYDQEANTPKAFIADLAPLLIEKLLTSDDDELLTKLLVTFDQAFMERQLLAYSNNPISQSLLERLGWAGEIRQVTGDYLQIVHNNTGGGKTDRVIKDHIQHNIKLQANGSVHHKIRLTRSHTGNPDDLFEGHDNLDYIRFYVPLGSQLISAAGFTAEPSDRFEEIDRPLEHDPDLKLSDDTWSVDLNSGTHIFEETGRTVFGNWIGLLPGQTKTLSIEYLAPSAVVNSKDLASEEYTMYWQKQAGSQGAQLDVTMALPSNVSVENIYPATQNVIVANQEPVGKVIKYTNDLRVDRWLTLDLK